LLDRATVPIDSRPEEQQALMDRLLTLPDAHVMELAQPSQEREQRLSGWSHGALVEVPIARLSRSNTPASAAILSKKRLVKGKSQPNQENDFP
jgi:hypothetical protein